jgi:hypothetical protein
MCLTVTVKIEGFDREDLERLAQSLSCGESLGASVSRKGWFRRKPALLHLGYGNMCACDLLSDEADWDAPTWAMNPAEASRLSRRIATLGELVRQPFTFEVLWHGTRPVHTVSVDVSTLASLADQSRLETKTSYYVVPD